MEMNVMTIFKAGVNVGKQTEMWGIFFFNHWTFKIFFFRFLYFNKGEPSAIIYGNSFLKLRSWSQRRQLSQESQELIFKQQNQ